MRVSKRQLRRIIKEEKAKLVSEVLSSEQLAAYAEEDRLEDARILQEFISDLEELVMTALQNEVPEHEASKQLMMLGRSLRS
jgi:hypothetical protein